MKKLRHIVKRRDPETGEVYFEAVRLPNKEYFPGGLPTPKPSKGRRARKKRRLQELYGPAPEQPAPLERLSKPERIAMRAEVIAAAGGRCEHCGSTERLTADHIVPLARGGSNHRSNFQCLCEPCNQAKGTDIWAARHQPQPAPFL